MSEYRRVGEAFSDDFPSIDLRPILDLVTIEAELYDAKDFSDPVCSDPDDDKFVECAVALKAEVIITGDKVLKTVGKYMGIKTLTPQQSY